mmetsp:Transcript_9499/g.29943  ORF Transcript_9499/g.29943 Transcript_9499/m.29943 type:complete len:313 (-) Transcript_9499:1011-1949(-)
MKARRWRRRWQPRWRWPPSQQRRWTWQWQWTRQRHRRGGRSPTMPRPPPHRQRSGLTRAARRAAAAPAAPPSAASWSSGRRWCPCPRPRCLRPAAGCRSGSGARRLWALSGCPAWGWGCRCRRYSPRRPSQRKESRSRRWRPWRPPTRWSLTPGRLRQPPWGTSAPPPPAGQTCHRRRRDAAASTPARGVAPQPRPAPRPPAPRSAALRAACCPPATAAARRWAWPRSTARAAARGTRWTPAPTRRLLPTPHRSHRARRRHPPPSQWRWSPPQAAAVACAAQTPRAAGGPRCPRSRSWSRSWPTCCSGAAAS